MVAIRGIIRYALHPRIQACLRGKRLRKGSPRVFSSLPLRLRCLLTG
jgi:hypothetical protein